MDLFLPGVGAFAMGASEKARFLESQLETLRAYHLERCGPYAALVSDWNAYGPRSGHCLSDYPFIPVSVFKEYELKSADAALAVVKSSSTTSDSASKIFIDKATRRRQTRSANMILGDFIGMERRPYVVFDSEETVRGSQAFSARGAAILSLAPLASEFHFVMNQTPDGLRLDATSLLCAIEKIGGAAFMAYGFTYILYQAHVALRDMHYSLDANPASILLHSGGWKKLADIAVDKATFGRVVSAPWGLAQERVIDFYGLVEQIGVPYPDCAQGVKHVPYWAEILIRRADSLEPAEPGELGLIQLLSALPLGAPNQSVLTEDLGRIERLDGCPCGRAGTAFVFEGRAPESELRGCSDVLGR
jgi:hypothetical protein